MLRRLDRILVAVPDLDAAAAILCDALGAAAGERDAVAHLRARRLTLGLGESEIELLAPDGDGAVADHLARAGSGLWGVGFATDRLDDVRERVARERQPFVADGGVLWVGPMRPGGLQVVLSPSTRPRAGGSGEGLVDRIYEVTHPVADERATTAAYVEAFGLDPSRFAPIQSKAFGYTGTLTLLDPPRRLDRIEVTQTNDPSAAMDRFFKRRGEALYMCFGESRRLPELRARLDASKRHYDAAWASDVVFIHPKSLGGMLMGISADGVAWRWSTGESH